MKKIGITGSLASGKTTASKILSNGKGPLFSADHEVKKLYKNKNFKKILIKKLKLKNQSNIKNILKRKILENSSFIIKLEKIIHPHVRRKMFRFEKKISKKSLFFLKYHF